MKIGTNLPGPFYVSWRVEGRRSSGGIFGLFIDLIVMTLTAGLWVLAGILWLNWLLLRGVYRLSMAGYHRIEARF